MEEAISLKNCTISQIERSHRMLLALRESIHIDGSNLNTLFGIPPDRYRRVERSRR
ncbi:MAG: hypothetical protein JSU64_07125 [candidate division WOR-3 bacterium]|nr:MAG: hypothetical protein JSU64_07125 [candidate division WOR-3 bacterium]